MNVHVYPFLPSFRLGLVVVAAVSLCYGLLRVTYNLFFHPLSHFPGPRGAACTRLWLAYMELVKRVSLSDLRAELHRKYGDVVRISPNELHFSHPAAYNEIYNAQNKWDKDHEFYRAFDVGEAFFAQTNYLKSKHSRALVSNFFSRQSISELQHLVRSLVRVSLPMSHASPNVTFTLQLDQFCDRLKAQNREGKSSDLYLGFQCFSADTITNFCFAASFNQLSFPEFRGDIVLGIDIAMDTVTLRKFSDVFIWLLRSFPHSLLARISPALKGLLTFRRALKNQIEAILRSPQAMDDAPHRIIYRELLNPEAIKGRPVPTAQQLLNEAEVLFSAGSHTVGTVLMTGVYHLLHNPETKQRLVDEVRSAWPVLDSPPSYEELERLPFLASALLTAVIKEMLRIAPAVPAGLPRVVPPSGAVIAGVRIPGGPGSKALDNCLVAFSKGPRSCLGINLGYCELYLALAYLFRRFDVRADLAKPADLKWSEHFLPLFEGQHLHAYCDPLDD
ncbi:cytochrome P450 [Lactarius akahatsu]|uniref:Cytochrome P450 n=1 Tax=Lactarius akahatsu TaxID=416441 RepID=A0AAD4L8Q3_9AGAM|nr:cytochrome P450 [Lactarius akahatsu]